MKFPIAPQKPVDVTFGAVKFTDPYSWLEEESPEALDFQAQQDAITQDWLLTRPVRKKAEDIMASMPRIESDVPLHGGGRWFRKRTPLGQKQHVTEVADAMTGPWRTIIDLNAIADGKKRTIDALVPSPDGKKLIYSLGVDGSELAELHVLDVETGKKLQDGIRQVRAHFPSWNADSSAFYYVALDPAVSLYQTRVYRQTLGAPPVTKPEDYEIVHTMMWAKASSDGRHTFMTADHLNPRPEYLRDEKQGGPWTPFLSGETAQFRGDIIGDRYYAITNDGASCGRVVSIPLSSPKDRSTWKELIPGSDNVLATMLAVDGLLVLVDFVDTYSRMRVFDTDGRLKGEIPMPGKGAITLQMFALFNMIDMFWRGAKGEVLFPFSSPLQSASLHKANVHTLAIETISPPLFKLDGQIQDLATTSADGARVPYRVVARAGVDLRKPQPTVMYGYGGFQASLIPGWPGSWLAAWVKAGGVLVLMHLRGGGELGPDQWHQGRLKNKQNSFNDVYAIAEDVVMRGITTKDRLGVVGGSNGGTMAAGVAIQRPDLFRASLSQVPVTDVLARRRDPVTMGATLDYGDPDDAEMSNIIKGWSPHHNIKDGISYPTLLLDAGGADQRCPPWHVRKTAARLQPANTGPHPILMRVRKDTGHGAADVEGLLLQGTDWLVFFMDQLGLDA